MKKLITLILCLFLSCLLVGCVCYQPTEAIDIVDTAIDNMGAVDYTATFVVTYSSLQESDTRILNTTKFDIIEVEYEVEYNAENNEYTQRKKENDIWETNTYNSLDDNKGFIGDIFAEYKGIELQSIDNILAVKRGNKKIIRYYTDNINVINENEPYEECLNEKHDEWRYLWNNISVMDTETLNFTVQADKIMIIEYYTEKVEQQVNTLSLNEDIVGLVTEKVEATIYIEYK